MSTIAYDKSLSIDELHERTKIRKEELINQLHYLTTQGILVVYGPISNVPETKWFLLKPAYYLDKKFLKERKVQNFEKYKRGFSYIGIPLGLVFTILSLWNKVQLNNNTKRIDTIETKLSNKSDQNIDLEKIIFYRLDSAEFQKVLLSSNSEGLYETDSDFGFYSNRIIEEYKGSETKVKVVSNKEIKKIFDDKVIEHPYGFVLYRSDSEFKLHQGIQTDIGIQQMISDFLTIKNE